MINLLCDRSIIEIQGPDRKQLLQGLITNDISKAQDDLIYAAMLNNKGRFLYDFFIFENQESLFLDCQKEKSEEIAKKLNFYKLRSDVSIHINCDLKVFFSDETLNDLNFCFDDPRNKNLGYRIYKKHAGEEDKTDLYHQKRIALKIPEGTHDLTPEKSLILEFDFDNLNATDYQKGCYVGQELTARTHHMGQIRKKLYFVKVNKDIVINKNTKINCESSSCGIILSSFNKDNCLYCLALIKDEFIHSSEKFEVNGEQINIIN